MCCVDRKKYDHHQQKQAWSVSERSKARSSLHRKIRWNCRYDSEYDENNSLPVLLYEITTHFLKGELQRISINSHNTVSSKRIGRTFLRPRSDERVDGAHDQLGRHVILISNGSVCNPFRSISGICGLTARIKASIPFQPCVRSSPMPQGKLQRIEGSSFMLCQSWIK